MACCASNACTSSYRLNSFPGGWDQASGRAADVLDWVGGAGGQGRGQGGRLWGWWAGGGRIHLPPRGPVRFTFFWSGRRVVGVYFFLFFLVFFDLRYTPTALLTTFWHRAVDSMQLVFSEWWAYTFFVE